VKKFYILTVADEDKLRLSKPSAHELALYRLKNRKWGLNHRTRNVKQIVEGDGVLVYASGKRALGMTFVGKAEIKKGPMRVSRFLGNDISSPNPTTLTTPPEFVLELKNIELFKAPVPIKSIYRKFKWVRNPESPKWGAALMGGTMHISKSDFNLVVKAAARTSKNE